MENENDQLFEDNETVSTNGNVPTEHRSGVFVFRTDTPQGIAIAFETVGGFDILAVPSILELATKVARQNIGLTI